MMDEWWLYLVRCRNGTLYTGITTDVKRRFEEHCKGTGAKYLRGKAPLTLEFHCIVGDRSDASRLEYFVKRLDREQKEALLREVSQDPKSLHAFLAGHTG
ncbi:MAG: GIY-YIG nuclease family protein [Gammaproteobacteria bacterium]|jgi:putative endonuclease